MPIPGFAPTRTAARAWVRGALLVVLAAGIAVVAAHARTGGTPPPAVGPDVVPTAPPADDGTVVADQPRWLASHQGPDGRWSAETFDRWVRGRAATFEDVASRGRSRNDVLTTSLALLAFLGAGYGPTSSSFHGPMVAAGTRGLRAMQRSDGAFGDPGTPNGATNHAVAMWTLTELVEAWGDPRDAAALRRAVEYYRASRASGEPAWQRERGPSGVRPIGWMALACHTSRQARRGETLRGDPPADGERAPARRPATRTGLDEDPQLRQDLAEASAWLRDPAAARTVGRLGLALLLRATPREAKPTWKTDPELADAARELADHAPRWDATGAGVDVGGWMLATEGLYAYGGIPWATWEKAMKTAVVDTQRKDGTSCTFRGSWDPVGDWADEGGRVFATTTCALMLTVWYRYEKVLGAPPDRRASSGRPDAPRPQPDEGTALPAPVFPPCE